MIYDYDFFAQAHNNEKRSLKLVPELDFSRSAFLYWGFLTGWRAPRVPMKNLRVIGHLFISTRSYFVVGGVKRGDWLFVSPPSEMVRRKRQQQQQQQKQLEQVRADGQS